MKDEHQLEFSFNGAIYSGHERLPTYKLPTLPRRLVTAFLSRAKISGKAKQRSNDPGVGQPLTVEAPQGVGVPRSTFGSPIDMALPSDAQDEPV